jgi:hypothetical protein
MQALQSSIEHGTNICSVPQALSLMHSSSQAVSKLACSFLATSCPRLQLVISTQIAANTLRSFSHFIRLSRL